MKKDVARFINYGKDFLQSFIDKELTLFAASLSFYTIFSLIPLLLIMMTLLTSLPAFSDYYLKIQDFIFSNLMPVNSEMVMEQINSFLQNSSNMGAVGFVAILVSSLLFFQNFEYIANKIFNAKKRTIWEAITTFWTLLTLTPIGLGISFYITGYVATLLAENQFASLNILPFLPYMIIWGVFFIIFQIAPNAKVHPKASAISSFFIAIVFSIAKNAFIYYVFYNKSYATMYGSFSIVLFLFLWIYFSWLFFLYGLKLCHMIDSVYKKRSSRKVQQGKKFLTIEGSK